MSNMLTRDTALALKDNALAALQSWASENGLEVDVDPKGTRFSPDMLFLKLKIRVLDADPHRELADAFRAHAHTVGLQASDLGKVGR